MPNQFTNGRTFHERLYSRLVFDPSGCLLWTGTTDKNGYGVVWVDGKYRRIHRVMWEMYEEPIPDGLVLDHVKDRGCTHKNCASVAHLEPVTNQVNVLRGDTIPAAHAAKTHCDNHHKFTEANTYLAPDGARNCRACRREADRRYKARKKAAA